MQKKTALTLKYSFLFMLLSKKQAMSLKNRLRINWNTKNLNLISNCLERDTQNMAYADGKQWGTQIPRERCYIDIDR